MHNFKGPCSPQTKMDFTLMLWVILNCNKMDELIVKTDNDSEFRQSNLYVSLRLGSRREFPKTNAMAKYPKSVGQPWENLTTI